MPGDRAIEVAPQLEQQELLDHINLGDLRAVAPKDSYEMVALQPLQRFPHRRTADAKLGAKLRFRPDAARWQLQRNDHLFQASARLF